MKIKVAMFTGTRADYGVLKPLLRSLISDERFSLKLVVSGSHYSINHGLTYREIEEDGFNIDYKAEIMMANDSVESISTSASLAIKDVARVLESIKPDYLIILGDRYEALCAALAATFNDIKIAHLHGGEVTHGSQDDMFRHAITKLSHLHFVSSDEYRRRVIQLGEQPDTVLNTGSLAVEGIKSMTLLSSDELEETLGITITQNAILVTMHPETVSANVDIDMIQELFDSFGELTNVFIIFTLPNADLSGFAMAERIKAFVAENSDRACYFHSLGSLRYLSLMKYVRVVMGNSSSGLYEAPVIGVPTINIGDRQSGRLFASSVVNTQANSESIVEAYKYVMRNHSKLISNIENPYAGDDTVNSIKHELTSRYKAPTMKYFHDLNNIDL